MFRRLYIWKRCPSGVFFGPIFFFSLLKVCYPFSLKIFWFLSSFIIFLLWKESYIVSEDKAKECYILPAKVHVILICLVLVHSVSSSQPYNYITTVRLSYIVSETVYVLIFFIYFLFYYFIIYLFYGLGVKQVTHLTCFTKYLSNADDWISF